MLCNIVFTCMYFFSLYICALLLHLHTSFNFAFYLYIFLYHLLSLCTAFFPLLVLCNIQVYHFCKFRKKKGTDK